MVDENFLKIWTVLRLQYSDSATLHSSIRRTKSLTPVDQYRLSTHHKSVILLATLKKFPICLFELEVQLAQ